MQRVNSSHRSLEQSDKTDLDLLFDHLSDIIIDSFLYGRNTQYTDDSRIESEEADPNVEQK